MNFAPTAPDGLHYTSFRPPVIETLGIDFPMIFAEITYEKHYDDIHNELLSFITARFSRVEAGHQGDSYIWIFDGGEKVAIDTFTSMKHQIKSSKPGSHVQKVIDALRPRYRMTVYETPEFEGFEERPVA